MALDDPTFGDVRAAAERIAGRVVRTPVLRIPTLDELVGRRVHLKAEHLQVGGAFKARGATHAVLALSEAQVRGGVAAHSSGNHAAALARAAAERGVPCHIVMPRTAPRAKQEATRAAGARIVWCEPTMAAREAGLREVLRTTGAVEVHPSADPMVIAGQGTATLELLEEVPAITSVVAPVGGGGLLSGAALAAHGLDATIDLWGAEPATLADAHRSLAAGELDTTGNATSIADGLAATLGPRTFRILRAHHVRIRTVSEDQILAAMELLYRDAALLVEPSAATAVAGLLALVDDGVALGDDVGVLLSGGNVDRESVPFDLT
ncbi:MAG: threonine/serine dehydratase [Acidimicrobiales bacterium]